MGQVNIRNDARLLLVRGEERPQRLALAQLWKWSVLGGLAGRAVPVLSSVLGQLRCWVKADLFSGVNRHIIYKLSSTGSENTMHTRMPRASKCKGRWGKGRTGVPVLF